MPRKGKGQQPIVEMPSPGYGEGEELTQMQRDVSLPEGGPITGSIEIAEPSPPAVDPIALAAEHVNPTGLPLHAPTQRPEVPITHGLPTGPGPGPEIYRGRSLINRRTATAEVLSLWADLSDNPEFARLARKYGGE